MSAWFFLLWAVVAAWAGEVRVDMVDVGQGDSILIRTPAAKTILIDAGDHGANIVAKLRALGVDHLDLVVATHPHADHIGDMLDVVEAFPVKLYSDNGLVHTTQTYELLMQAIEARGIPYRVAEVGQTYTLDDGARLEVLFPNGTPITGTRSDLNSNSVVTRLTHGKDCMLFMGDAEEPTERALMNQGLTPCEVLKVAHHGSDHSSTSAFLNAVQPRVGLISVGTGNRYHHPGEATLPRLISAGIEVHRTDLEGTITVYSSGKGITVTSARLEVADADTTGRPQIPSTPLARAMAARAAAGVPAAAGPADAPTTATTADSGPPSTPTPALSGPPAPAAAACPYYASASSEVFHEADCGNVARIKPENLTCYASREAAISAGKRPAGCCHP